MMFQIRLTNGAKLKLRKSDSSLSVELLKGLGLAVFIHVALFLLFRITTLPNLDIVRPLMPIAVETDISGQDIEVLPIVIANPYPMDRVEPPRIEHLIEMAIFQPIENPFPMYKSWIEEADFSEVEKQNYYPIDCLNDERLHD